MRAHGLATAAAGAAAAALVSDECVCVLSSPHGVSLVAGGREGSILRALLFGATVYIG